MMAIASPRAKIQKQTEKGETEVPGDDPDQGTAQGRADEEILEVVELDLAQQNPVGAAAPSGEVNVPRRF